MRFALHSPHAPARRAMAALLLAAFCVASIGVLPSHAALAVVIARLSGSVSGASEAFPCQDGACGCATASECWTSCCCNSAHERLVWALERGVLPPAIARFSDTEWIAAANAVKPGSAHCGSCVVGIKASLRKGIALAGPGHARPSAARSCCGSGSASKRATSGSDQVVSDTRCCSEPKSSSGRSGSCCESAAPCDPPASEGAKRGLPCLSALGCKGAAALMAIPVPPSVPCDSEVEIVSIDVPATPSCAAAPATDRPVEMALDVPAPPPKRGC